MAIAADPDLEDLVADLARDPRCVHVERLPARPARTGELARPLPAAVRDRLGVEHLWSHQVQAIDLVRAGRSVAVATGTASGKSLCYQAPIAESIVEGLRPATALLVFPTKALAQDQLRALTDLEIPRLVAATYDGDAGQEERAWVRRHANVLLTNPEMLHHGILPNHARWATFLMRLRYVVVDELHLLRGVFGSHVAHLLRRLRRLCRHYGSDPVFVFSSATIGRPGALASALCGLDVDEVTDDGSPRGERLFVLWNPTVEDDEPVDPTDVGRWRGPRDEPDADWDALAADHGDGPDGDDLVPFELDVDELGGAGADVHDEAEAPGWQRHRSANRETADLVAALVRGNRRTIAFCRSRRGTEVVAADVARRLPAALAGSVRPYRAGYLAAERREIERELFDGTLRGVVATSALELGVDIGGLDACVLNGFPGTIASLWQQAGRAGREQQQSLALLVGGDDQLDQWLMRHPTEVFTRPPEPAVINPANPFVLHPHLACAAYELPLTHADEQWWPDLLDDAVLHLVEDDLLRLRTRRGEPLAAWAGHGWPADRVGLRGREGREVRIALADDTLVGTVGRDRAPRQVHPGASYLHRGVPYRVLDLDLDDGVAWVERTDGGEYTRPRSETDITILAVDAERALGPGGSQLGVGDVRVVSQVTGYRRYATATGELLGVEDLDLPPDELVTRGMWFTVPPAVLDAAGLGLAEWPGTLHAAEHAAIGMLPLFTICDRWDVGGVSTPLQADTGLPTIVIHDAYPGGAGIAELAFEAADRLLASTLEAIEGCGCTDGCPSCVQSPKCGNGNEPLDKAGAAALLRALLGER